MKISLKSVVIIQLLAASMGIFQAMFAAGEVALTRPALPIETAKTPVALPAAEPPAIKQMAEPSMPEVELTISDLLEQLRIKIEDSVPTATRPKHFVFALKVIADEIKNLKELLQTQSPELQLITLPLQNLKKQLLERFKSITIVDAEDATYFADQFRTFLEDTEKLPITNKALKKLIKEIPDIFIEDLLDLSIIPSRSWIKKAQSYALLLKKKGLEKYQYAKSHPFQTAGTLAIGAWGASRWYLDKRYWIKSHAEEAQQKMEIVRTMKEDAKFVWEVLTGKRSWKDIFYQSPQLEDVYSLEDLIGLENVKEEFNTIIKLKNNEELESVALLLVGEPGLGKTASVEAFASIMKEKFRTKYFTIDGPKIVWPRMFLWLLEDALREESAIVFIDEIEKTDPKILSTLLTDISSAVKKKKKGLIILAAANSLPQTSGKSTSDPLQTRFKIIHLENPNTDGRKLVLVRKVEDFTKTRKFIAGEGLKNEEFLENWANFTEGLGIRELENIIQDSINKVLTTKERTLKPENIYTEVYKFLLGRQRTIPDKLRELEKKSKSIGESQEGLASEKAAVSLPIGERSLHAF